jgi:RimJ/RimL family protein N-acetyltransferase
MIDRLSNYRHIEVLRDGPRVLFRPLHSDDRERLAHLFAHVSTEDGEYFRTDITAPDSASQWCDRLDYTDIFPIVALVNERIVGLATLYVGDNYTRHVAWIHIYLDKEFRRRGVGTAMIKAEIDIARMLGLQQIIAEVVVTQPKVIRAFEELGFKFEFQHRDYFITKDGETFDMAVLVLYLSDSRGEF